MQAFPRAAAVICSLHLLKNTKHYLINKAGATSHEQKLLKNAIFGANGITLCTDVVTFEEAVSRFDEGLLSSASVLFKTYRYFNNCLLPLLHENMKAGCTTWTNNNIESMNNVQKETVQYRPQMLPELIDKLRDLVDGQFAEADRAMCGRGDFQLQSTHVRHKLTDDVWSAMLTTCHAATTTSHPPIP